VAVELVGLWDWLAAGFERYCSAFRMAAGGRRYDLAHDVTPT
jgi:hypothetical protein